MMKPSGFFSSDRLNPVLLKELRQYLHNRFIVVVMGLLLLAELLLILWLSATPEMFTHQEAPGSSAFIILWSGLGLTSFAVCVLGSLFRFIGERGDAELDYSRITTLTPWKIVSGKLQAALLMMLFIGSLCLPFMVIAYFLRGVALLDMLLLSGQLLVALLIPMQLALLLGATGKRYMVAAFFGLFFFVLAYPLTAFLVFCVISMTDSFWGPINTPEIWGMIFFAIASIWTFLLLWTVAVLKPPQSNKMWSIRICLCLFTLTLPVGYIFGQNFLDPSSVVLLAGSVAITLGAIALLGFTALFEPEQPSHRVLLKCPEEGTMRFVYFLFAAGYPGAVILSVALLFGYWLFGWSMLNIYGHDVEMLRALASIGGIAGYVLLYVMLALLCRRYLKKIPAWAYFLLIFFCLGLLPLFAGPMEIGSGFLSPFGFAYLYNKMQFEPFALTLEGSGICLVLLAVFVFLSFDMLKRFRAFRRPKLESASGDQP